MPYKEQLLKCKTIPSLNGWRAFAVMIVILGHLKSTLQPQSTFYSLLDNLVFPEFGVRIFFVLSGFLITTLLVKEKEKQGKINIKNFFIRRFLRIVPVLWLYLLVVAGLNHLFRFDLSLSHFLGPFFYLNNFNFFPGVWLLGHTWSLAVEEQFYLIWPFLFRLSRNITQVAIFFISVTPFIILITYFKPHLANLLLEPFLRPAVAIFTGALLSMAWIKNFYNFKIERFLTLGAFFTIMALSLAIYILRDRGIFGIILYPAGDTLLNFSIAYLIVFSILKKESLIFDILNNSIVIKIGTLSYSIYLWQQLFIIPKDSYVGWSSYLTFPINLLAIAAVAWLSYHYFEEPFLKLKNKFSLIN